MKVSTLSFPSVFEPSYGNTENTANDLISGIKVRNNNLWYVIGELAKKDGLNPQRIINSSPDERDYELLFKAALLNLMDKVEQPLTLTLGLPFSTFNVYKQPLSKFLEKKFFSVEYNTETFTLNGTSRRSNFEIGQFDIIPELVGGVIGVKKMYSSQQPKNFIVVSLGYGTAEGGMATEDGLLQRTCFSVHGIRYVVNNLQRELNKLHYLELKNEFQINDSLMKGVMIANRKKIELRELRKDILSQYYKQVISPSIKNHITDRDFEKCECIYLIGGGVYYDDLRDAFYEEFKDFMKLEAVTDSQNVASIGYLYNSYSLSATHSRGCVGIDLGNSSTIISYFSA